MYYNFFDKKNDKQVKTPIYSMKNKIHDLQNNK